MEIDTRALNGPIPGQSLTTPPGNAPYERPPEIDKPEDAAKFHLERLSKEGMAESVLDALELGVDVKTLTEGVLRGAVSQGMHSIDVSLIIAPLVHEKIVTIAEAGQIEYDEGLEEDEDRTEVEFQINKSKVDKMLAEEGMEPEVESEEVVEERGSRGFMSPRGEV
jgi:citrate lyase alpha subunit